MHNAQSAPVATWSLIVVFALMFFGAIALRWMFKDRDRTATAGIAVGVGTAVLIAIMGMLFISGSSVRKYRLEEQRAHRAHATDIEATRKRERIELAAGGTERGFDSPDHPAAPTPPTRDGGLATEDVIGTEIDTTEPAAVESKTTSRPAWIGKPARFSNSVYETSVSAGPHARLLDCQRELDAKLLQTARDYISSQFGHVLVEPSVGYLRANAVADEYVDSRTQYISALAENQLMHEMFWRLEFDDNVRAQFEQLSRRATVSYRLAYAGFALAATVVLLASVFVYLRVDQATDGRHRMSLKFAVAAALVVLVGCGYLLVQMVPLV